MILDPKEFIAIGFLVKRVLEGNESIFIDIDFILFLRRIDVFIPLILFWIYLVLDLIIISINFTTPSELFAYSN